MAFSEEESMNKEIKRWIQISAQDKKYMFAIDAKVIRVF